MAKNSRTKRRGKIIPKNQETAKDEKKPNADVSGDGGNEASSASASAEQPSAFDTIVAESQERISEKTKVRPQSERKRAVGRPKGTFKTRPAAPESAPAPQGGTQPVAPTPTPSIAEHLVAPLQALSMPYARKHQIAELALTQEEAFAIATGLDGLLKAFAPTMDDMDPRVAAAGTLAITAGVIFYSKAQIFATVMAEREKLKAPETGNKPEGVPPKVEIDGDVFPSVAAEDHFRKPVLV